MRVSTFLAVSGLLAMAQGCIFNNVSSEETLRDAVVGLNDEVRWDRMDLATQRVAPSFRTAFSLTHHDWHEGMQIADSEILHVQMGEDKDDAKAFIEIRWYDQRTMLVAETTLEQKWKRVGRNFVLISEEVRAGDPRLIALPEGVTLDDEDEDSEGDEVSDDDDAEEAETASRRRPRAG